MLGPSGLFKMSNHKFSNMVCFDRLIRLLLNKSLEINYSLSFKNISLTYESLVPIHLLIFGKVLAFCKFFLVCKTLNNGFVAIWGNEVEIPTYQGGLL